MCKAITKAGVDITPDDIEDCHRVGNKGQTIIKFGKRKVSRQVLSVSGDCLFMQVQGTRIPVLQM